MIPRMPGMRKGPQASWIWDISMAMSGVAGSEGVLVFSEVSCVVVVSGRAGASSVVIALEATWPLMRW